MKGDREKTMPRKTLEEMSLIDNFLMQAVSSDQEISEPSLRCILSVLLQRKIGQISVNAEKMIPGYRPDHRGIRMDVEVIEKGEASSVIANVYDVEWSLIRQMTPISRKQTALDRPRSIADIWRAGITNSSTCRICM